VSVNDSFADSFDNFYNNNGKKAGTYTYFDNGWWWRPRQEGR
jgi:hypothetical protein